METILATASESDYGDGALIVAHPAGYAHPGRIAGNGHGAEPRPLGVATPNGRIPL